MTWTEIQTALARAGFDPGVIDGIPGRNTLRALKAFQSARGLDADGIPGPLTTAALLDTIGTSAPAPAAPPWMVLLEHKMGLSETRDNAELRAFLKSDGHTLGDPATWPWCGDLVETCIALALPAEVLPTNPYLARNWQSFGVACANQDDPGYGAVCAFWRTSREHSSDGHVAFAVGRNASGSKLRIRGGNQGNAISDVWIARDRLLSAHRPLTWTLPLRPLPVLDSAGQPLSTNEA